MLALRYLLQQEHIPISKFFELYPNYLTKEIENLILKTEQEIYEISKYKNICYITAIGLISDDYNFLYDYLTSISKADFIVEYQRIEGTPVSKSSYFAFVNAFAYHITADRSYYELFNDVVTRDFILIEITNLDPEYAETLPLELVDTDTFISYIKYENISSVRLMLDIIHNNGKLTDYTAVEILELIAYKSSSIDRVKTVLVELLRTNSCDRIVDEVVNSNKNIIQFSVIILEAVRQTCGISMNSGN